MYYPDYNLWRTFKSIQHTLNRRVRQRE